MLAKYWKKIGLIIVIIACLCTLINKLTHKVSFDGTIEAIKVQIEKSKDK